VLAEQLVQLGAPAQTSAAQHVLLVPQSAAVHGQQLPDESITVPLGHRMFPLLSTTGRGQVPASGCGTGCGQPAGHATGSLQPTMPLQFVSVVLVQSSGPGSTLPVHGPYTPNSVFCTHVWVPSWHVPTLRVAAGPV
jgi:hypothetical protein